MYNYLIVDDERWIREGVKVKLKNKGLEIGEMFEASDGEEALQIAEEKPVDIIITDIRMTNMDGLELIEKVKSFNQNIKYIILSGYADFEYAKKALDMQVSSYLLKPVKEKELVEKVEEIIKELELIGFNREDYLVEQRVNAIFHDNHGECNIDDFTHYSVAILDIQREPDIISAKEEIIKAIQSIEHGCTLMVVNNFSNSKQLILLMMANNREEVYKARKWLLYDLFYMVRDKLEKAVTIGVSDIEHTLSPKLYKQAKDSLILILIHGISNIYYYREQSRVKDLDVMDIKNLEKYMECKDIKSIKKFINRVFDINSFTEYNALNIKYMFYKIIRHVRYMYRDKKIDLALLNMNYNEKEVFHGFLTLEEVREYLIDNITSIIKSEKNSGNVKDVLRNAIDFVNSHYDKDITVKDLSTKLGINSNYLSTLFKKETGKTFTQYLTDLRITAAVKLLTETDANVSQIAKSVGYQDAQYFYRVFKKSTGKTPLSYRKLNSEFDVK